MGPRLGKGLWGQWRVSSLQMTKLSIVDLRINYNFTNRVEYETQVSMRSKGISHHGLTSPEYHRGTTQRSTEVLLGMVLRVGHDHGTRYELLNREV
jgi:hypothetical protein